MSASAENETVIEAMRMRSRAVDQRSLYRRRPKLLP